MTNNVQTPGGNATTAGAVEGLAVRRGIPANKTSVDMVIAEMRTHFPGVWIRALDLQRTRDGNVGLRASIPSISNSLRHGSQMGLIERRPVTNRFGRPVAANISEWRVKP